MVSMMICQDHQWLSQNETMCLGLVIVNEQMFKNSACTLVNYVIINR